VICDLFVPHKTAAAMPKKKKEILKGTRCTRGTSYSQKSRRNKRIKQ